MAATTSGTAGDNNNNAVSSAASATGEGPVLTVITKRLRALRKKHNRILQMEESLSQGKTLNKEQQDVLRSKPSVLILIDELEKLRQPLSSALDEELSLSSPPPPQPLPQQQQPSQEPPQPVHNYNTDDVDEKVKDLVNLMYFGSLFDVKPQSEFTSLMLTRTHERGCCLTYDYVTDDNDADLLGERDLDLISALQGLLISRPVNSSLSHQNALEQCVEHAKRWLNKSDEPIHDSLSSVTYAGLREKLNKIMALDYFTATPQMKGPGEVAAAAAVGNFGSFQVPVHDNVVPVEVPVQGEEGSAGQYQETEENAVNYEEYETGENQSGTVEESHKDDLEAGNPPEVVSAQTDHEQLQADGEGYRNVDYKEQQYIHRRGQRGGRGGRRGYPNGRGGRGTGRGGGPYQNGRNQYYDNYNPRNYYNRRGGRGGGGGNYYNHPSPGQGNYTQANAGVES